MDKQIKVSHALYLYPDEPTAGESLSQLSLESLLRNGEWALARKNGWFFNIVEETFVFVHLVRWDTQEGASREGEYFFNVFTVPSHDLNKIYLKSLIRSLKQQSATTPDKNIDPEIRLQVPQYGAEINDQQESIAYIYENLHKNEVCYVSIDEMSVFNLEIDHSIEGVKMISELNKTTDYFNFVEGKRKKQPDPELVELISSVMRNPPSIKDLDTIYSMAVDNNTVGESNLQLNNDQNEFIGIEHFEKHIRSIENHLNRIETMLKVIATISFLLYVLLMLVLFLP